MHWGAQCAVVGIGADGVGYEAPCDEIRSYRGRATRPLVPLLRTLRTHHPSLSHDLANEEWIAVVQDPSPHFMS
jgi:hypothetical protein